VSVTKDRSVYLGSRIWMQDENQSDPSLRGLLQATNTKKLLRTRTGDSNPHYKQQIRDGQNATTQMSGVFESLEGSNASVYYLWDAQANQVWCKEQMYGDLSTYDNTSPVFVGNWGPKADARATAKFYSSIRAAQVGVSGPTFLGELRETLQMIRKPAAALQDSTKRYLDKVKKANANNRARNKGKPSYARELSNIASGLWLEQAFGWTPLIHDVKDAIDTYNHLCDEPRLIKLSSGGNDQKETARFDTSFNPFPGTYMTWIASVQEIETVTVRYRGAVRAQAATTAADRFARFGFTPSEFIPTAWELLPWSFLADYFANIGDILSASCTDTSNLAWVSKSVINKKDRNVIHRFYEANPVFGIWKSQGRLKNMRWSAGQSTYRRSAVTRTPNSGISLPSLTFTYPSSDGRLLNVAALMAQVGIDIHPQNRSRRNYRL
jgi:hypothetical protein